MTPLTPEQAQRLDPWSDAKTLALRLQQPGAELLVALGAEGWCTKCQTLRPAFEQLCAVQAPAHCTWLWLDLEDHAEFMGDFIPVDLPLLLRWRAGQLVQAAVLEAIESGPAAHGVPAERLRELPLPTEPPPLWAAFTQTDWAR